MWKSLPDVNKIKYKRMILAFASLTESFSQKADEDDETLPAPIINTKYQETMFRESFDAVIEDIGNTSYDASVHLRSDDGTEIRCLVGIKTFGISSGEQKVAQFKKELVALSDLINSINENSKNENGRLRSKDEIDLLNHDNYLKIAKKISEIRNQRIRSSKENLRGFRVNEVENNVESVYHVLMPSQKGKDPKIYVGEISYDEISIPDIEIIGCTKASNPLNFAFTDGNHEYKFTVADSQLYMDFKNNEIVEDTWNVIYADNPYEIFSNIADEIYGQENEEPEQHVTEPKITESYSWSLLNKEGEAELFSGFNSFYATGSKQGLEQRKKSIKKFQIKYENEIAGNIFNEVIEGLDDFLNNTAKSAQEKKEKIKERERIIKLAESTRNENFLNDLTKLLFRPMDEMYIPIPNAKKFHEEHPDFFAPNAGKLKNGTSKLALPKESRSFNLVFEPSGESIRSYISQDTGKAIESVESQSYLGEWILRGIFQLDKYEPLTAERMEQIGINAVNLYRTDTDNDVHIKFTWIEKDD